MALIEEAYALADEYAKKTNGYVGIRTLRFVFVPGEEAEFDYIMSAQALGEPKSFRSIEAMIARLKEMLK
jgi:hypothetical protein